MARWLDLADLLDRVPRFMGKLAGWLILPLIAVIMFDVITRKIDVLRIGMSELAFYSWIEPIKLQDLEWHLHAVILLLSFGFGYLMNAHVRIDIFREMASRRRQAWIELIGLLTMALPYLLLTTWFAWVFVRLSYLQNEGSESLSGIPHRYIIKSFTLIGLALTFSAFAATFIRLWAYLFGSTVDQARAERALAIFASETVAPAARRSLAPALAPVPPPHRRDG